MSVTRDQNYPVEYAQLLQIFNRCADGFGTEAVLNASLQMVAAAIGFAARSQGATQGQLHAYTDHVLDIIRKEVSANWERAPSGDDIEVKSS